MSSSVQQLDQQPFDTEFTFGRKGKKRSTFFRHLHVVPHP